MEAAISYSKYIERHLYGVFIGSILISILILQDVSGRELFDRGNTAAKLEPGSKLLGSRPPNCKNKCMGCTPCTAFLTIPPHPREPLGHDGEYSSSKKKKMSQLLDEQHNYYNLAWKCKCRNKTFQP